jgi:LmbE family N-acetylglucosaminyl deacetylase
MKAMVMVAHPDDCVIFAYSFMNHYKNFDWTVCYLTYTENHPRGNEFAVFWKSRGVKTKFLGYTDHYRDLETGIISFDTVAAANSIKQAIADQTLILTHDHKGDYGHIHHEFIHRVVDEYHSHVVFFAGNHKGNVKYSIGRGTYKLDEFPLHREVVEGFHLNTHENEYSVSPTVMKIL